MIDVSFDNVRAAREAIETADVFHFVGIGGVGMSALARYMLHIGKRVTGTDRADSERLRALAVQGARVRVGHDPHSIPAGACVVYTTAIPPENPELAAARARGLTTVHRAELLAAIANAARSIAITGTHGKTTTTAMLAHILASAGREPTAFVGGEVNGWPEGNLLLGRRDLVVFEACESDGTLLLYRPSAAVITSLEPDHLDQHGTFANLCATVAKFASSVHPDGTLIASADSPAVVQACEKARASVVLYGRSGEAGWRVLGARPAGADRIEFTLQWPGDQTKVVARTVGRHNALNAAAAIAAAHICYDVPVQDAVDALATYPGVARRFQVVGRLGSSLVVHDYAHHPSELRATLNAARDHYPGRPVAVIFQPHLYSRTRDLMDDFAGALCEADLAVVLPIYGAREDPLPGVSADVLVQRARRKCSPDRTALAEDFDAAAELARSRCSDGWVILVLGAGDVEKLAYQLAAGEAAQDDAQGHHQHRCG